MAAATLADAELQQIRSQSAVSANSTPSSILQPIDMDEAPPVRTKIRMVAILIALYVCTSFIFKPSIF